MRALWLSWGIGLANFLFTFPTYYLIDKRGRRFLLLLGFPAMAISMLIACLSFNIHPSGLRDGFIIFFIFAFFLGENGKFSNQTQTVIFSVLQF